MTFEEIKQEWIDLLRANTPDRCIGDILGAMHNAKEANPERYEELVCQLNDFGPSDSFREIADFIENNM